MPRDSQMLIVRKQVNLIIGRCAVAPSRHLAEPHGIVFDGRMAGNRQGDRRESDLAN
jgi:hypothetical protein